MYRSMIPFPKNIQLQVLQTLQGFVTHLVQNLTSTDVSIVQSLFIPLHVTFCCRNINSDHEMPPQLEVFYQIHDIYAGG